MQLSLAILLVAGAAGAGCGGQAVSDLSEGLDDLGASGGAGGSGRTDGTTAAPSALTFNRIVAGRDQFCGITRGERRVVCVANDQIVSDEAGPYVSLSMNDDVPHLWEYRCAVKESGELTCFGTPNATAPPGEFVEVAVGLYNACARQATGQLKCWVPESLGGLSSVEYTFSGFSVDQWSVCSQLSPHDATCIGRDGMELLPHDGSGHLLGGTFLSVKAAPRAACAAISVAIPKEEFGEFGELGKILNKDNIACFSADGARTKVDGLFFDFDVNANEDGCAIHADQDSHAQVACWGAFAGSVPVDLSGPFVQVSVSTALACLLDDAGRVRCWRPTSL